MEKADNLLVMIYGTVYLTRHVVKATDKGVTRIS